MFINYNIPLYILLNVYSKEMTFKAFSFNFKVKLILLPCSELWQTHIDFIILIEVKLTFSYKSKNLNVLIIFKTSN